MTGSKTLNGRTARLAWVFFMAAALPLSAWAASPLQFAPFKDALFAYPEPVAARDDGTYLDVPYSEARDIDERDEVPERRVRRSYVDLAPNRTKQDETRSTLAGDIRLTEVGEARAPSAIVIFVHGRNGDRRLGMNDWTFGGNFNRLKNLVTRAGGLYVTLDGGRLGPTDAVKVADVIRQFHAQHPAARIVLACGSMGGELCWTALGEPDAAAALGGLVLLGASSDMARFTRMEAGRRGSVPIVLAQGSRDQVYRLADQEGFFQRLRRERPGYPVRFIAFDGGNHGTPIRMIDWRETLNWIVSR